MALRSDVRSSSSSPGPRLTRLTQPDRPECYVAYGRYKFRRGEYEQAENLFRTGIEKDPKHWQAHKHLADTMFHRLSGVLPEEDSYQAREEEIITMAQAYHTAFDLCPEEVPDQLNTKFSHCVMVDVALEFQT